MSTAYVVGQLRITDGTAYVLFAVCSDEQPTMYGPCIHWTQMQRDGDTYEQACGIVTQAMDDDPRFTAVPMTTPMFQRRMWRPATLAEFNGPQSRRSQP
jgi:hypothetical protein